MGPLVVVAVTVGGAVVMLANELEAGGSRVEVTLGVVAVSSSSGLWKVSPRATEHQVLVQFTTVTDHTTTCNV